MMAPDWLLPKRDEDADVNDIPFRVPVRPSGAAAMMIRSSPAANLKLCTLAVKVLLPNTTMLAALLSAPLKNTPALGFPALQLKVAKALQGVAIAGRAAIKVKVNSTKHIFKARIDIVLLGSL